MYSSGELKAIGRLRPGVTVEQAQEELHAFIAWLHEQFDVPETGEFFDQETLALDDIAAGAADVLVTSILEGF